MMSRPDVILDLALLAGFSRETMYMCIRQYDTGSPTTHSPDAPSEYSFLFDGQTAMVFEAKCFQIPFTHAKHRP